MNTIDTVRGFPVNSLYTNFDCVWSNVHAEKKLNGRLFSDHWRPYLEKNGYQVNEYNPGSFRIAVEGGTFDYHPRSGVVMNHMTQEKYRLFLIDFLLALPHIAKMYPTLLTPKQSSQ